MSKSKTESALYSRLGASSSKSGVHNAVGIKGSKEFFADPLEDVCGDENYYSVLHADAAGTKALVAYLAYRESGDCSWFAGLPQDALIMNLDDIACINAFESLTLSNVISRNKSLINDEILKVLINSYKEQISSLKSLGINITMAGGETEDLGDILRTIAVGATLFARVKKSAIISCNNIESGDVIVGLSSTGQASYEKMPNSGIGSNGLTLARHAMIANKYARKYPEICDPALNLEEAYQGKDDLLTPLKELDGLSVAQALLSPTRTYAPIVKTACNKLGSKIHAIIHCTGGAQAKILGFGSKKHYIKDNLFPAPAMCRYIQKQLNVPWDEMYSVLNMGHRMEIILPKDAAPELIKISESFNIEAKVIGHVRDSETGNNQLSISSEFGKFDW